MKQHEQNIRNLDDELAALDHAVIVACRRIHRTLVSDWHRNVFDLREQPSTQTRIIGWLKGLLRT